MDSSFNIKISDDPVKVMEDIKTLKAWIAKTQKDIDNIEHTLAVKRSVIAAYEMVLEDYYNSMKMVIK